MAKNNEGIHYPSDPDRTLSWQHAFPAASAYFPGSVASAPTRINLDLLGTYRDKAIHFYNDADIDLLIYSLTQTSIVNFRDVLLEVFEVDLVDQMNWRLLPIGIRPPIDVISYLQSSSHDDASSEIGQFLKELSQATDALRHSNEDTGRLLTVYNIKMESIKKIGDADVVVGVNNESNEDTTTTIVRTQDPNQSHPLRQKEILNLVRELHGKKLTPYVFQAIVWKHGIKGKPQYCWIADGGFLTKYSNDVVTYMKQLSASEIDEAVKDYGEDKKMRRRKAESSP